MNPASARVADSSVAPLGEVTRWHRSWKTALHFAWVWAVVLFGLFVVAVLGLVITGHDVNRAAFCWSVALWAGTYGVVFLWGLGVALAGVVGALARWRRGALFNAWVVAGALLLAAPVLTLGMPRLLN